MCRPKKSHQVKMFSVLYCQLFIRKIWWPNRTVCTEYIKHISFTLMMMMMMMVIESSCNFVYSLVEWIASNSHSTILFMVKKYRKRSVAKVEKFIEIFSPIIQFESLWNLQLILVSDIFCLSWRRISTFNLTLKPHTYVKTICSTYEIVV